MLVRQYPHLEEQSAKCSGSLKPVWRSASSVPCPLVDEFTVHYSPVFFGNGERLFNGIGKDVNVRLKEAVPSENVTHVTFEVVK